mmetsp:Transcript_12727/g.24690  ORF Transcript_12727/g.24690 Transcript_12727/m.24690 type:complete len:115 (+) Transcript_12727:393-737(+)
MPDSSVRAGHALFDVRGNVRKVHFHSHGIRRMEDELVKHRLLHTLLLYNASCRHFDFLISFGRAFRQTSTVALAPKAESSVTNQLSYDKQSRTPFGPCFSVCQFLQYIPLFFWL